MKNIILTLIFSLLIISNSNCQEYRPIESEETVSVETIQPKPLTDVQIFMRDLDKLSQQEIIDNVKKYKDEISNSALNDILIFAKITKKYDVLEHVARWYGNRVHPRTLGDVLEVAAAKGEELFVNHIVKSYGDVLLKSGRVGPAIDAAFEHGYKEIAYKLKKLLDGDGSAN